MSERYSNALQPTATALGQALGLPQESTAIFAEEVVRGTPSAPLAQLSAVLAPNLRQLAGLDSWQIISPGSGKDNFRQQIGCQLQFTSQHVDMLSLLQV